MNDFIFRLKIVAIRFLEPVTRFRRYFGAPKMLWGFRSSDGIFHPLTRISSTAYMYNRKTIHVSNNVFIWHFSILDGTEKIIIGEGTQIGAWTGIFTHSSHLAIRLHGPDYVRVPESLKHGYLRGAVSIGAYTWFGAGVIVFPGVTIGKGALISAGSIVKSDVPDFAVVSGNPGKVVGDVRMLDQPFLDDNPHLKEGYKFWSKEYNNVAFEAISEIQ